MVTHRAALAGLGAIAILALAPPCRGDQPSVQALSGAVTDDADVVLFPPEREPGVRPTVTVATRVQAPPATVGAVLLAPERYHDAIPALISADVVETRPARDPRFGSERLLAWELEIPLFNLKGRAWLSRSEDGIDLSLLDGAFAPGLVRFRLVGEPGRSTTLFTCEVRLAVQASNWLLKRVARHDVWAPAAMTAAVAWTLARAVALEAEAARGVKAKAEGGEVARPRGPMSAPEATALDGAALAGRSWASLRANARVAAVRRTKAGRLAWVSTAVTLPGAAPAVATRLAAPETWAAFPGWASVRRLPTPTGTPEHELLVQVKDGVPFVDLDGTWRVSPTSSVHATTVDGATRGAVLRWQTFAPAVGEPTPISVLSMHPRMDATGFVAKRMIAAEPLLEHALALALAYVDAAAVAAAFYRR